MLRSLAMLEGLVNALHMTGMAAARRPVCKRTMSNTVML